jgi:hypothetical protein
LNKEVEMAFDPERAPQMCGHTIQYELALDFIVELGLQKYPQLRQLVDNDAKLDRLVQNKQLQRSKLQLPRKDLSK